ncbi:DNA-binding transcriptional regulator [Janthinobacterium sp. SUN206]|uniref:helix-turn-helix domain-containing protein n=1 Tax=Janthinobacterium sp. SUN206 TaxID=3014787 RepID=UPI0027133AB6|nr:helix-turn-helix transcriptional regulator [Janthinobacterium sp. SUN206]MDO8065600.1 helix-turn-helix transcriptional regulator [Janthinobacterium sp. SUN206]
MNPIQTIRGRMRVTQVALAKALGVTQSNVSHYEQGQEMPPQVAKLLIKFAASLGEIVSYNDIYGEPTGAAGHCQTPGHAGRQPPTTNAIFDTVPARAAVGIDVGAKP